jgi:hypothetical protein
VRLPGNNDNTVRFVRGDRIVEVQRLSHPSDLPNIKGQYDVRVAINDSLDGGYGTRQMWSLPDEVTATNAALALMQILDSGQAGLVMLDEDNYHRPALVPFTLNLDGLPSPNKAAGSMEHLDPDRRDVT